MKDITYTIVFGDILYSARVTKEGDSLKDIFANTFTGCTEMLYKSGMGIDKQALYTKVINEIDEAKESVTLRDVEFDFLHKAIKDAETPPNLTQVPVANYLDGLKLKAIEEDKKT